MRIFWRIVQALLVLCSAPVFAQPHEYLYVENSAAGTVSVIAVPENKLVGTIPASKIGHHPDDVAITPDGSMLLVNRLDSEDVVALDARTEKVLFTVPVGGVPNHITVSRDGRLLYVPIFNGTELKIVDLAARKIVGSVDIGMGAHATRLSPDGKRLYVGHMWNQAIMVVDLAKGEVVRTYEFDRPVRPFAVSPDEKTLYVQTSNLSGFYVVDTASGRIARKVEMPTPLPPGTTLSFPYTVDHGLALTADGKRLLAAGSMTGHVAIFAVPDMKVLADIPVGREPNWIALSRDERFAYVSNRKDDTISVIDMAALREVGRIAVGDLPQRMHTAIVDREVE
ncbi:YVTN family beta-propeller repeat protein [Sphingomonas sp. URHD0057]|uniref:YVTN family beta-propeller repeat protein n=1 Tax=Sphingomonas sp. URHD0057 TaxID=1380389 RepID=UPI00048FB28B|nr:beta-propeller fold lactonase family protein [Sphingomonas sp. URHD0057]